MFYAAYKDHTGQVHSNLYYHWSAYFADTFNPDNKPITIIEFRTHGRNYAERKASAAEIAQRFQAEQQPGLSWGELAEVQTWFESIGKQYGLLTEFRENAIC